MNVTACVFGWIVTLGAIPPRNRRRRLPPLTIRRLESRQEFVDDYKKGWDLAGVPYDEAAAEELQEIGDEIAAESTAHFNRTLEESLPQDVEIRPIVQILESAVAEEIKRLETEAIEEARAELGSINIDLDSGPERSRQPVVNPEIPKKLPSLPTPLPIEQSDNAQLFPKREQEEMRDATFRLPLQGEIPYGDMNNGTFYFEDSAIDIRLLKSTESKVAPAAVKGQNFVKGSNVPVQGGVNFVGADVRSLADTLKTKHVTFLDGQCANCSTCGETCINAGQCIEFEEDFPMANFPPTHGYFRTRGIVRLCQNDAPSWRPLEKSDLGSFRQMGG
eukprot:Gregarina_sp_Poly_1__3596@NODE_2054_length_2754_cov_30_090808_g27_i2_p1_GENE_NODE_2054_length_2754_cov_30_090808_g27_i2NODE_2054_length_2754_cov_30_090808_g27_i2_p1_ORF_typecomplete_len333_score55_29UPF0444/PF15475_6/0_1_NODE_2054_length_2754_cov_30_090808_g27_i25321530